MSKRWKSIEDLNKDQNVNSFKDREFQEGATELVDSSSRRSFIKLLGGATALAGLSGCAIRKPYYKIVPYTKKVPQHVPGESLYYASSFSINGSVQGILVETQEGRPIKIEGNPNYPGSNGGSTVFAQSSLMDLYDPDRLQSVERLTKKSTLNEFKDFVLGRKKLYKGTKGKGLYVLVENVLSPTYQNILSSLKNKYPNIKIFRYEPCNDDLQKKGIEAISGLVAKPKYNFKKANVIVSFSGDFLGGIYSQGEYIKDFSDRRDPDSGVPLNRLYSFEERFSVTGAKSDHHYPVKRSDLFKVASVLLIKISKEIGYNISQIINLNEFSLNLDFVDNDVVDKIAQDLIVNRGKSLVVTGEDCESDLHQIVFLINEILANNFVTVDYTYSRYEKLSWMAQRNEESIRELTSDLQNNLVEDLYILGGDPVYSLPESSGFAKLLGKADNRIHLTLHKNETSLRCNWVLPRLHFLESWSDLMSHDGVVSIVQPVIKRMVEGLNDIELLNFVFGSYKSDFSLIRKSWNSMSSSKWERALHDGYIYKKNVSVFPTVKLPVKFMAKGEVNDHIEMLVYPDYKVYDGRFSNNGWLQELPDPINKLTWDNAALIAPKTAKKLNLKTGDIVDIQYKGRLITVPIFISPGNAVNSISIALGYGKTTGLKIEDGVGFSVTDIFSNGKYERLDKVTIVKKKGAYSFASTQNHGYMENRPHFRYTTVDGYKKNPNFANEMVHVPYDKSLWKEHSFDKGYQWGMAIDLSKCVSCNVCITSCQAENNIPIVGKEEVMNGREMHWIRTDRYYEGDPDNPKIVDQPVTCLHCENAPCEQVCPVAATVHDDEGLNVMVYNRCVGTRYCSDNCPAKVRRFNFFDYHQRNPHSQKKNKYHIFDYIREPDPVMSKQFNPDVTVRMRGVMEKCTYCIQRIKSATQKASNENREIFDGEVVTACQQACPAQAITMGNILDKESKIYKLRKKERNYSILEQLLLRARTTYLAAVYNPNPLLSEVTEEVNHGHHH